MEVRRESSVDNSPIRPPSQSAKQPKSSPNTVDSCSVTQRLQKELMSLMMSDDLGVSAFPQGENIFTWVGTIEGGKGTQYEGLSYKLSLKFPFDYPFKPPQVRFETMCFHPNVDQYGNICLDILQDKWSSAYDVRTILLSIQSLLGEPNNDSPLNSYAAGLWCNKEDVHFQHGQRFIVLWLLEFGLKQNGIFNFPHFLFKVGLRKVGILHGLSLAPLESGVSSATTSSSSGQGYGLSPSNPQT